jgi:hypothetical protein
MTTRAKSPLPLPPPLSRPPPTPHPPGAAAIAAAAARHTWHEAACFVSNTGRSHQTLHQYVARAHGWHGMRHGQPQAGRNRGGARQAPDQVGSTQPACHAYIPRLHKVPIECMRPPATTPTAPSTHRVTISSMHARFCPQPIHACLALPLPPQTTVYICKQTPRPLFVCLQRGTLANMCDHPTSETHSGTRAAHTSTNLMLKRGQHIGAGLHFWDSCINPGTLDIEAIYM